MTVIGNNLTRADDTCITNSNTGSASINISWPTPEEYYSLNIEFTAVRKLLLVVKTSCLNSGCVVGF